MDRRDFLAAGGATLLGASMWPERVPLRAVGRGSGFSVAWSRDPGSGLVNQVAVDGRPLVVRDEGVGVLDGFCQFVEEAGTGRETVTTSSAPAGSHGPIRMSLEHTLKSSFGDATRDLLVGSLTLTNTSDERREVSCGFLTGARPCRSAADQMLYVPISARGLSASPEQHECRQSVGQHGYSAYYFEPEASEPRSVGSYAILLAPVMDILAADGPCRVALFGSSGEPVCFRALKGRASAAWRIRRRVRLDPGRSEVVRVHVLLHRGEADRAWEVFRRFGHREDFAVPEWLRDVRVHYYDFLSAAEPGGPRGAGYIADLKCFGEFHVRMATQHGYYLSYGDFIHPDRKEWAAMPSDPAGPVPMSLKEIRARVDATRKAGVHPMIYMHFTILDEGSPLFPAMRDEVVRDESGNPTPFGWRGPDVIKQCWTMSHASARWRDHLVQQAQWIMELLDPDGIVLDETFTASGWDHHPDRREPLSRGGIELMRRLRAAVRSFGPDKALLASDCSMGSFCLWADGEAGDHCYDRLLAHPLYRQEPVRYLAALGAKPWLPCAWLFETFWSEQMDLARKTGAAVSVTNGWGDGRGLARLSEASRRRILGDIATLM